MLHIRRSHERGYFDHGWLKTHHTFSFGSYFDRHNMAFRNLRVINEDRVSGGQGFDMHPHKDMEIVTYVVSGALEHQDSMGNGAVIRAGDVQYMSAASGVLHSEKNPLGNEECHLLQIWILPRSAGGVPVYGQRRLEAVEWQCVAAPDDDPGRGNAIAIRADTKIFVGKFAAGATREIPLRRGFGWVQVVNGGIEISAGGRGTAGASTEHLVAGDGVAISEEGHVHFKVDGGGAELLLFELP